MNKNGYIICCSFHAHEGRLELRLSLAEVINKISPSSWLACYSLRILFIILPLVIQLKLINGKITTELNTTRF